MVTAKEDRPQMTALALNWHIPSGVLYDLVNSSAADERASGAHQRPWRIIVHFQGLPSSEVPRCTPAAMRSFFFNAVKQVITKHASLGCVLFRCVPPIRTWREQALYIESGSVQRWFGLPVAKQDQLYEGLVAGDVDVFLSPHASIATPLEELKQIPVRVLGCSGALSSGTSGPNEPGVALQSFVQLALPPKLSVGALIELVRSRCGGDFEDAKAVVNGVAVEDDWRLLETWKTLQCPDHFLYFLIRNKVG
eukprot:scaffold71_cov247-Pinguiococcus_pyrenoidosus.AAC.37